MNKYLLCLFAILLTGSWQLSAQQAELVSFTQRNDLLGPASGGISNSDCAVDMNKDGKNELIYAGNLFNVEVETVRYDSGIGGVLEFNNNEFSSIPFTSSGFNAIKDARQVVTMNDIILVANNNGQLDAFQIN